jgi:hypothetical protein
LARRPPPRRPAHLRVAGLPAEVPVRLEVRLVRELDREGRVPVASDGEHLAPRVVGIRARVGLPRNRPDREEPAMPAVEEPARHALDPRGQRRLPAPVGVHRVHGLVDPEVDRSPARVPAASLSPGDGGRAPEERRERDDSDDRSVHGLLLAADLRGLATQEGQGRGARFAPARGVSLTPGT